MAHDPSESSVAAGRLRYDHRSFATRFVELRRRASICGWRPLAATWDAFVVDVTRHFAFEELSVFPGFARRKPGAAGLIASLVDAHEDIRRILDALTASIATDDVDPLLLDGFTAKMGAHEELESTRLYPWLELQNRAQDPGARSRR